MQYALAITHDLHLDVPGTVEEAFQIKRAAAERRRGLGLRGVKVMLELGLVRGNADAAPAAAGAGLEHDRKADPARLGERLRKIGDLAIGSRHDRNTGRLRRGARRRLVAHRADGFGARADEHEAGGGDRVGEPCVLGQKSIAGVNGAGASLACGGNNRFAVEIALGRLRRTDADRFVGEAHREAVLVGVAKNRDRAQAKFPGGADDAHRDLAAVGYQKLIEHA